MRKLLLPSLVLLCFLVINQTSFSQNQVLPPNQPEQDACSALILCGNSFFTPYSYQGIGSVSDLSNTPCSSGEANSMWMKITVTTAGTIVFKIIPVDPVDDYDFAVVDITNTSCSNLSSSAVVRCNFDGNYTGTNPTGIVGLDPSSQMPFVQSGATGNPFCSVINATVGDTYLIMVNNFGSDYIPNSTGAGFTLDFSGSTAAFNQAPPPAFSSIDKFCSSTAGITLHLTSAVLCSSIAADGSDFFITPSVPVSGAIGANCNSITGYTNTIVITFANTLTPGSYTLNAQTGTDGNTLLDLCGGSLPIPSSIALHVATTDTTVNQFICYSQLPYRWNGMAVTYGGNNAATYTTTSSSGCDSTTILNLTVSDPPLTDSESAIICSNHSYKLPWDSTVNTAGNYKHIYQSTTGCDSLASVFTITVDQPVNINQSVSLCIDSSKTITAGTSYSYLWNTGATTAAITASAQETYSAIATDSLGCMAYDTFRITVYSNPVVKLGNDITLCQGDSKTIDAGTGFQSYLWNDGSTTQTITTNVGGSYWVTVKDMLNCPGSDTISLTFASLPRGFLPPDTVKCFYSTITLQPLTSFDKYLWSTGATTEYIPVLDTGLYQLQVTDQYGCIGKDSLFVRDSACQEYVYIPTAFTPNKDGKNDIFRPLFKGVLVQYHFVVFNRFGQKVFDSNDPNTGWNGTIDWQPQPPGTYVWLCSYQLYSQPPQSQKGTVVLIR